MLCVISANTASSVEIHLSWFENKTAFFLAFLQESGKELDVRKNSDNCCKFLNAAERFFLFACGFIIFISASSRFWI